MSVKVHEAYCLDSQEQQLLWWDDFLGDQLQDEWRAAGTGSAVVIDQQTGGICRITTGATTNDNYVIDWNDIKSLHVSKKVALEIRVKLNQTTQHEVRLYLYFDIDNYIMFFNQSAGAATNWDIFCKDNAATTSQDSGVLADTSYHIFRIECHTHGSNHVHFYIDGAETNNSPISTNVPDDATDYFQPYLRLKTLEDVAKSMDVDYVVVRQNI